MYNINIFYELYIRFLNSVLSLDILDFVQNTCLPVIAVQSKKN